MPRTTDTHAAMFEQLRSRLESISYRIVRSEAEAEDIVQECFLKWHGAEKDALMTPVAWLTTVVQHQSIDHLRKRVRDLQVARTAMELVPDVPPAQPDDGLLRRADLSEALARLLTCLSPPERLALVLYDVFECEHADIAVALGTKTVNARQYLARARRRLREIQGEASPDEKLCHELIRRFQTALNGNDVPTVVTLLTDDQPLAVSMAPQKRIDVSRCANDPSYGFIWAA
jgi:RNA polymerase sigma factor (sigma-70 family)